MRSDQLLFDGGPSIDAAQIDAFERIHELRLPDGYKAFLVANNGGRPPRDLFAVPGCEENPVARLHFFFGVTWSDDGGCYDIAWNIEAYAGRIPEDLLPIGTTEGADVFAYRSVRMTTAMSPTGTAMPKS